MALIKRYAPLARVTVLFVQDSRPPWTGESEIDVYRQNRFISWRRVEKNMSQITCFAYKSQIFYYFMQLNAEIVIEVA